MTCDSCRRSPASASARPHSRSCGCSIGALTAALTDRADAVAGHVDIQPRLPRCCPCAGSAHLGHVLPSPGRRCPPSGPTAFFGPRRRCPRSATSCARGTSSVVVERIRHSLTPDGVVLLCHLRHAIRAGGRSTQQPCTIRSFAASCLRLTQGRYVESALQIVVLASDDSRSEVRHVRPGHRPPRRPPCTYSLNRCTTRQRPSERASTRSDPPSNNLRDRTGARWVTVVADSCTDATLYVVARQGIETLTVDVRSVGRARDAGCATH